jgi:polar amino acid transport system permease protein
LPNQHSRQSSDSSIETSAGDLVLIRAKKLPHPWRNLIAVLLLIAAAALIWDASRREAFDWDSVGTYIFDRRVLEASLNTLQLTIYSMLGALVLGTLLAIMRQSANPILKSISWIYIWVLRGTPVYVQLVFWGLFAVIYKEINIGLPFLEPWFSFETKNAFDVFAIAIIGLALNEAAYMAEIVRAGLLAVDRGQIEAAKALGMSGGQIVVRILLPQAMRFVIPPTGNEVISMLKTTSLVTAVPYSFDLYARTHDIAAEIFNPIPLLIVASIWYLAYTTILMIGQHYLEKRFSRGFGEASGHG